MLAKRRGNYQTRPTPNWVYAKGHRIAYTQSASSRVIQNDIVSSPAQDNLLKCSRSGVVDRRVGGARRICSVPEFSRQLTREFFSSFELLGVAGNLAGQSGAQAGRSPFD
ncbi:hypothetical protein F511_24828 [Dorcoceras hygrometricum]|uniref:Uncharacterized protein n=1 Tax=Dorcoceras hygrometricum TaxID=472368 RepID=A0A2Z7C783_9LAMI|nr:hypothetical protein F511_24828 [Dorcoceras hygrometricum]